MTATPLLDWQPPQTFHGSTYEPTQDHTRLKTQFHKVFNLMSDGQWRTLVEISESVKGSEAALSARLRDFRKIGHTVNRRRIDRGLFAYQLLVRK
jgi:hypothetical protein